MKRLATWTFCIKEDKLLLAMKKRGFGVGLWNVPGGKVKESETAEQTAIRETEEEIGIYIQNLEKVAEMEFEFRDHLDWGQTVIGFLTREWEGEPVETEEMSPKWFRFDEIPYEKMWADDKYWLPKVLEGKKVKGKFVFEGEGKILHFDLKEVE